MVFSYSAFAKPGPHGPRGGGFNKPGFNKPHGGFNKPGPNRGPMNKPGPAGGPGVGPNHKGKIVKYDNNNNGQLDPAEKKYMHTDKNHDGKVGPVEKKFAENHQPTQKQHQNFIEQADTDGNGFVNPSEKKEFIKDQKSQVTSKWENNIDTNYGNGDGVVSGDELEAFKAEHPDFKIPGKHPHKPHNPSFNPELMDPSETGIGAVLDTEEVSE